MVFTAFPCFVLDFSLLLFARHFLFLFHSILFHLSLFYYHLLYFICYLDLVSYSCQCWHNKHRFILFCLCVWFSIQMYVCMCSFTLYSSSRCLWIAYNARLWLPFDGRLVDAAPKASSKLLPLFIVLYCLLGLWERCPYSWSAIFRQPCVCVSGFVSVSECVILDRIKESFWLEGNRLQFELCHNEMMVSFVSSYEDEGAAFRQKVVAGLMAVICW